VTVIVLLQRYKADYELYVSDDSSSKHDFSHTVPTIGNSLPVDIHFATSF